MIEKGMDLHELHALHRRRGRSWFAAALKTRPNAGRRSNHTVAVNKLLGVENRVGMTTRPTHDPTEESNAQLDAFFVHFLKD